MIDDLPEDHDQTEPVDAVSRKSDTESEEGNSNYNGPTSIITPGFIKTMKEQTTTLLNNPSEAGSCSDSAKPEVTISPSNEIN